MKIWHDFKCLVLPVRRSTGSRATLTRLNSPVQDGIFKPRLLPLRNTRKEVAWSELRAVRAAEPPRVRNVDDRSASVNSEIHIIETTTSYHKNRPRRRSLHPSAYSRIIQSLPSPHEVHSRLQGSAAQCPPRCTPRACSSIAQRTRPRPLQPVPHSRFLTMPSPVSPPAGISREEEAQLVFNPLDQ